MNMHTILIVEDEASICDLWTRILVEERYVVARAADAFDALRLLGTTPPTVAICDVHLPGPSGIWLADIIRERSPTTAIVLASGDPFVPPQETLRASIVAYIMKPISRIELVAAVKAGVAWSADRTRVGEGPPH